MNPFTKILFTALCAAWCACPSFSGVSFPGIEPGPARSTSKNNLFILGNNLVLATYNHTGGKLSFAGMTSQKTKIADAGGELFIIALKDGTTWPASSMNITGSPKLTHLPGNPKALKYSNRLPGKALEAVFTAPDKSLQVKWRAVLRDGSHYLRTEMDILSSKDIEMSHIIGMQYPMLPHPKTGAGLTVSGNTRGSLLVSPMAFAALETPMGNNTILSSDGTQKAETPWTGNSWTPSSWATTAPNTLKGHDTGLLLMEGPVDIDGKGPLTITLNYRSGNNRINTVGARLIDSNGKIVSEDIHDGFSGEKSDKNTYTLKVPAKGSYQLKLFASNKNEPLSSSGEISYSLPVKAATDEAAAPSKTKPQIAQGLWSRKTTLTKGQVWRLSSVLGILVPGQERRSFLAYSERERAVPYRPFIHYNSWYELNINRNNDSDPLKRMTEKQCVDVLNAWHEQMYKKRGIAIDAFVWDDGWDEFNSLWDFHKGFPNGFKLLNQLAGKQKAGIGAWLGPVGGYGASKSKRLNHWNEKHPGNKIGNFQLSNEEYYAAFRGRCQQMIRDYDMRFFKFDGISTHFHAKGPAGEEDAEGIIKLVNDLRKTRPDIYINCTVGTWASPFWFQVVDSVWRQENDWGATGLGDNREKWITYRDRLVWEVFVQGAPLCPINSLMFHGLMVTKHGPPNSMPREIEGIKREMRCSFACGSSLQELYVDNDIMTDLGGGVLWDELAKGIQWHRKYSDVLADVHWVGGCPWNKDSQEAEIYGWASWNGKKATLALRNPSDKKQAITLTLRKALDIPSNVKTPITLKNSYNDQRNLPGLTGKALPLDEEVTLELEPFEVFVLDYEGK